MELLEEIKKDHTKKSSQLKILKKKLKYKTKNAINRQYLKNLLAKETKYIIDPREYYYSDDNEGYIKDIARKEARIELLEEILRNTEMKQYF
jgi:hypothetical protein